jgi:hypothetical protein
MKKEYDPNRNFYYIVLDTWNGKVPDSTVWATDLKSYEVKQDNKIGDVF